MPRSMWRGAIQFGLVTIPVRLYLATESRGGLSFNLLHAPDQRRIQMRIHCPEHGEIPRSETVRGYEWSKDHYVVIEDSDLEAVPLPTVRAIEIEQFVPATRERRETVFVKQSYYLEPEPLGQKAFALLKAVLAERDLQAVCKIVLKDREQLAALDPFGPTMLLSTLYWPDEVRDVGELQLPEVDPEFKPAELDMARQLVETLSGEFDSSRYRDGYREALLSVIEAKVAGQPVEAPAPAPAASKLTDLMAILEASVAAAREEARQAEASAAPATPAQAISTPCRCHGSRDRLTGQAPQDRLKRAGHRPWSTVSSRSRWEVRARDRPLPFRHALASPWPPRAAAPSMMTSASSSPGGRVPRPCCVVRVTVSSCARSTSATRLAAFPELRSMAGQLGADGVDRGGHPAGTRCRGSTRPQAAAPPPGGRDARRGRRWCLRGHRPGLSRGTVRGSAALRGATAPAGRAAARCPDAVPSAGASSVRA